MISKDDIISHIKGLMNYFAGEKERISVPAYDEYCVQEHFEEKLKQIERDKEDDKKFSKNLSSIVVDFYVSALIKEMLYTLDELSKKHEIYPGSEECPDRILEQNKCRDRVYIATKFPQYIVRSAASIDKIFNEQLSRLRTEYIDYYLMHMFTDYA